MRTHSEIVVLSVAGKRLDPGDLVSAIGKIGLMAEHHDQISVSDALLALIERPSRHVVLVFSKDGMQSRRFVGENHK